MREAAVRLGTRGLSDLVMQISVHGRVFRVPQYTEVGEMLRRYSTATAHFFPLGLSIYCDRRGARVPLGVVARHRLAIALLYLGGQKRHPPTEEAWPAMVEIHQEIGAEVTRFWGLPQEIAAVASAHQSEKDHQNPLVAALIVARAMAVDHGAPEPFAGRVTAHEVDRASSQLSISGPLGASLLSAAKKVAKTALN